jgi:hypothetical protein
MSSLSLPRASFRPRHAVVATIVVAAAVGVLRLVPMWRDGSGSLPPRLSDAAFWALVSELSEPGGSFVSANYVSNENSFQRVIPELQRRARRGGVYLGVGPDQNFTYIVALDPRIAFIIDIRRENLLLHLMYKALIELSPDRAEFLSRLFSRPRPPAAGNASAARALLDAYTSVVPDETLFEQNTRAVADDLVHRRGFPLATGDLGAIRNIQRAFFEAGPEIRYAYPHRWFPSYADLVLETDDRGELHSYLSSEEAFRRLKHLETKNLIVPLVGDFTGTQAILGIGRYLRAHRAVVDVFYTSNVEFYLFENGGWNRFLGNVASLPLDRDSVFIRSHFDVASNAAASPRSRSATQVDSISQAIGAHERGVIRSYSDVIRQPDR